MNRLFSSILVIILAIFIFGGNADAQIQALLWDNDNASHYQDENGDQVDCEVGLEEALAANNVNYETGGSLPEDLSGYDIVFVELGLYCVG